MIALLKYCFAGAWNDEEKNARPGGHYMSNLHLACAYRGVDYSAATVREVAGKLTADASNLKHSRKTRKETCVIEYGGSPVTRDKRPKMFSDELTSGERIRISILISSNVLTYACPAWPWSASVLRNPTLRQKLGSLQRPSLY